ncbi:MAG: ABC transporter substrate-binding protein [Actinomycetota bacterium]|jgi:multiple sugar transport system substrate-binding protein|nr:ABC transporter substrate-binding protein [Actinomycetota bacterium]
MKRTIQEGRAAHARPRRVKAGGAVGTLAAALTIAGVVAAPSAMAATRHAPSITTITWWASPISTSGPDLRQTLINAFAKQNPNIHVKLETAPTNTDTNRADLVTTISGGAKTPDVFMGDVIWPGQFGAHALALPLSKYLPKSFFNRFASGLVAGASYKGQVYGAPFFQDQGFLYYRKDLLAADHMSVPKTWEQLRSEAATLVKQHKVKYGFVFEGQSYEGGTCDFMEYYADTGGQVLNSTDTKSVLNVGKVTKVLSFVRSLVTSGASPAAVSTFEEPQAMAAFQNGEAAFLRNWDYAWSVANTKGMKSAGKVGVAPLPTFAGQPYPGYSNIGGWNLYINPHSRNIKADLTFIKFITGTEAQTIEARPPFSEIPTNAAVRANPKIKALNPPFAVLSKTKLVPRPAQNPNYPRISQAIYSNFNSAIAGSKSPSAAANAMASQLKAALSSSTGL